MGSDVAVLKGTMKPYLETLRIRNFRTFRELEVRGLGRVNLVTGRNNTGKSSLLEAIRLIASDALPSVIASILRLSEEDSGESERMDREPAGDAIFPYASLFHGFPGLSPKLDGIGLDSSSGGTDTRLGIEVGWRTSREGAEGSFLREVHSGELWSPDSEPALVVKSIRGFLKFQIRGVPSLRLARKRIFPALGCG